MAKKNLPYPAEKIGELLIEVDNEVAKKSDLNDFVKKESGRGLSTNDYTTAEKNKLAGIQEGAQKNTVISVRGALQLNPQVGNVVISAADIGLGDANKRLTSLEDNVAEVDAKVSTLQGTDAGKSVRTIAAEETAKIVGNAPANYDTLKEIADYISSDATGAAELSNKVNKNATDIAKLAADLNETHQLASNAESAISEVVELTIPAIESEVANKATKSEVQGYATTAKNEAITVAATDAQNKANTAESNANTYADGKVKGLADGQVATNTAAIESLQTAQTSTATTVKSQGTTISTHTQQIANLDSTKLGKTEQAADSAKLDGVELANIRQYVFGANDARTIPEGTDFDTLYGDENLGMWQMLTNVTYTNSPITNGAVMVVRLQGGYCAQLLFPYAGGKLYYRAQYWASGLNWYQWRSLTTDDTVVPKSGGTFTGNVTAPKFIGSLQGNADSATKLATPRKIWGQSFDGSGDVNGNATITGQLNVGSYIVSSILGGDNVCQIANNVAIVEMRVTATGSARLMRWKDGAGKIIIESDGINTTLRTGNVGIGTTNPTEKLEVAGNIKSSGNVSAKGLRVEGDVVITGNVVIEGSVTSGASYQSNPLATISEDEVPSVEQQLRAQISSLEERIATLEQLIAQNNG